jgi:uncharacterized phage protein gp47/JayE
MSIEFTANGVSIQTLQEITDELIEGYKYIYGPDINVNPESPDGQRIGIEAKARADMQAFALDLYNQQDPDFASGQALISKMKYAGITVRPATRSQADIDVVSSRVLTLPAGFTIIDELGQEWTLSSPANIGVGTTEVTFFASEFGAIEADANTINKVVTVVIGVNSVNNPAPATVGVEEETTQQARIRRRKSVQLPALTPLGAIISRVANVAGVTDVIGYENDTKVYDPVTDIDPNTFWIIVEGGGIADIAEAMATSKTGGAGTKGAISGVYEEEIPRPSGGTFSIAHTMKFDRPTPISIHVRLNVKRKDPDQPVPIGTIADNLIARDYVIGQRVVASELYDTVYAAGNTFIAYNLEVSLNGSVWFDTDIDPGLSGKPFIDPGNISMIEVL